MLRLFRLLPKSGIFHLKNNLGLYCSSRSLKSSSIIRYYHGSSFSCSKKKQKGEAENDTPEELPDLTTIESNMDRRLDRLIEEFSKMKGGRADADMLNHINIESDGTKVSLKEISQIAMKSPSKMSLTVFDPNLVQKSVKAISEAGLGLNPTVEGNTLQITIPKPSKEAREVIVKAASKVAEKVKLEVRNVRKDSMDALKKLKSVSQDDVRILTKKIDALTEKKIEKISKMLKDKESELL